MMVSGAASFKTTRSVVFRRHTQGGIVALVDSGAVLHLFLLATNNTTVAQKGAHNDGDGKKGKEDLFEEALE